MITHEELTDAGFVFQFWGEYSKGNQRIVFSEGLVTHIRQGDNFAGIHIKPIDNIGLLNMVYNLLFERE